MRMLNNVDVNLAQYTHLEWHKVGIVCIWLAEIWRNRNWCHEYNM